MKVKIDRLKIIISIISSNKKFNDFINVKFLNKRVIIKIIYLKRK